MDGSGNSQRGGGGMGRTERIAGKIVAWMSEDEREDFRDELESMISTLEVFVNEIGEGDFSGVEDVEKQVGYLRGEQVNLEDERLDRDVGAELSEVARMLNEAETERRAWEEARRRHAVRCGDMARRVRELAKKFKGLEGRV